MSNFTNIFRRSYRCLGCFRKHVIHRNNAHDQHVNLCIGTIAKTRTILHFSRTFSCAQIRCYSTSTDNAETPQKPTAQTTIDEEEMHKFTKLAQLWWDEFGEFQALHALNDLRIPMVRDCLVQQKETQSNSMLQPLQGLTILDAGSGGGILSEPLARLGAFVIGVDMVEDNIKVAQSHLLQDPNIMGRVKYIKSTVEDLLKTEEGSFDAVVASEVVEHVSSLSTFISSCSQLLKPGGSMFVTTINKTFMSRALAVFAAENILRLVPQGTHDWEKFVLPEELEYHFEKNGLSKRMIHGMCYNPLTCRWSWIGNTDMNYAVHAIKAEDVIETD